MTTSDTDIFVSLIYRYFISLISTYCLMFHAICIYPWLHSIYSGYIVSSMHHAHCNYILDNDPDR